MSLATDLLVIKFFGGGIVLIIYIFIKGGIFYELR